MQMEKSLICVNNTCSRKPSGLFISQTQANSPINTDSKHFLCPPRCGNQLCPNPLRFGQPRRFHSRHNFVIFGRGNPRGNELPALLFFGKRRPANRIRFTHLDFFDLGGGGVCNKARNASSNFTPLKLFLPLCSCNKGDTSIADCQVIL